MSNSSTGTADPSPESTMPSDDSRDPVSPGRAKFPGWAVALVSGLVVLGVFGLLGGIAAEKLEDWKWAAGPVSGGGFLLTATSLAAAIAIYIRQGQDATASERVLTRQIQLLHGISANVEGKVDKLHERISNLPVADETTKVAKESSQRDDSGQSPALESGDRSDGGDSTEEVPRHVLRTLGVDETTADHVAAYVGENLPLKPLAILYGFLTSPTGSNYNVEGGPDRLQPSELIGYRVRGKGPRFWYLSTPDAPGRGRSADNRRTRTLWRISLQSETVEPVGPTEGGRTPS